MQHSEIKVLVACEESQRVTSEFRALGISAWSCDIKEPSGGHPEWHFCEDVATVLKREKFDLMIAFPPCTHLSVSGAGWWSEKRKKGLQQEAMNFFMEMINAPVKHIAVENPIGIMNTAYRKADQIIHPYFFGDNFQKRTCLWLKNLPRLYHNSKPNLFDSVVTHVDRGEQYYWIDHKRNRTKSQPLWYALADRKKRSEVRSKTFPGIARNMAQQWSKYLMEEAC